MNVTLRLSCAIMCMRNGYFPNKWVSASVIFSVLAGSSSGEAKDQVDGTIQVPNTCLIGTRGIHSLRALFQHTTPLSSRSEMWQPGQSADTGKLGSGSCLAPGILLCSGPPSPCLHLAFCKKLPRQIMCFAQITGPQEKAEQKWRPCCPVPYSRLLRRPQQGAATILGAPAGLSLPLNCCPETATGYFRVRQSPLKTSPV